MKIIVISLVILLILITTPSIAYADTKCEKTLLDSICLTVNEKEARVNALGLEISLPVPQVTVTASPIIITLPAITETVTLVSTSTITLPENPEQTTILTQPVETVTIVETTEVPKLITEPPKTVNNILEKAFIPSLLVFFGIFITVMACYFFYRRGKFKAEQVQINFTQYLRDLRRFLKS